jgi:hypothetical protein
VDYFFTIIAFIFLVVVAGFKIMRLIARRRLRRSHYGHMFDFSKMPKKKIR